MTSLSTILSHQANTHISLWDTNPGEPMEGSIKHHKSAALFRDACALPTCFCFDLVRRNDMSDCKQMAHTRSSQECPSCGRYSNIA